MHFTKFAFISCHLAAHEGVDKCKTRNDSCFEILEGFNERLGNGETDILAQYHHVFWMGDMNYRTTFDPKVPQGETKHVPVQLDGAAAAAADEEAKKENFEDEEDTEVAEETPQRKEILKTVYQWVKEENWQAILSKDELNRELAAKRTLVGFTALPPAFSPTFKRKRHQVISATTAEKAEPYFDITAYYDPKRIPSYTDRILYKSLPSFSGDLKVTRNLMSSELTDSSDHKPVSAEFVVSTRGGAADILVTRGVLNDWRKAYKTNGTEGRYKLRGANYMKLVISDLKAANLSEMDLQLFGGKSDPYIKVNVDPPELVVTRNSKLQTSVVYHELNPEWVDEELVVVMWSTDKDGICATTHFNLTVWDWDRASAHDLIGTCVIPATAMFRNGVPVSRQSFTLPVVRNGTTHGYLTGKLNVKMYKKKEASARNFLGTSGRSRSKRSENQGASVNEEDDTLTLEEFARLEMAGDEGCRCTIS